jgi:hypothetical protein
MANPIISRSQDEANAPVSFLLAHASIETLRSYFRPVRRKRLGLMELQSCGCGSDGYAYNF